MAKKPNPRDLAFRALDTVAQSEQLMGLDAGRVCRPSFTELYQYVHGQRAHVWSDFAEVMKAHPKAAADLQYLLENGAVATMPQLAAAAGGAVRRREHDGYVLQITESRAEPEQVYLSIETGIDLIDQPQRLFIKMINDRWYELAIPPMTNGRAQIVLEKTDPAIHAFEQPDTVVYIH